MQGKIDKTIAELVEKENKWEAFLHYGKNKPYWNFVLYLRSYYTELQQKPLPFKHFDKLIHFIIQQDEWDEHMDELLEEYDGKDTGLNGFYSNVTITMVELLEDLMDDHVQEYVESNISWWLFDAPKRGNNIKGSTITYPDGHKEIIRTTRNLYDYILKCNYES